MTEYGFAGEIEKLNQEKMSLSFFQACKKLIGDVIRNYPPVIWNGNHEKWNEDTIGEIRNDFIVNYLFNENDKKIDYVRQKYEIKWNIDGLMVELCRKYVIDHIIARNNPYQANIVKRISRMLKILEESKCITRKECNRIAYFSKNPSGNTFVSKHDLMEKHNEFPVWKPTLYKSGKKISPVIGNDDLKNQILYIFDHFPGWISVHAIRSFFFWHLNLDAYSVTSVSRSGEYEDASPVIKTELYLDIKERLTPRQREIFLLHFIFGWRIPEIMDRTGYGQSTIYGEIKFLKNMLDEYHE